MSKLPFRPIQGSEAKINAHSIEDGYIYYATDSGKIFLDSNGKRITMGGSGVAIYYGNAGNLEENAEKVYNFPKDALEEIDKTPRENDLILNLEDGKFYKIDAIKEDYFECSLVLAGGGGGEGAAKKPKLSIDTERTPTVTVDGIPVRIYFTPTSAKDSDGTILDKILNISWSIHLVASDGTVGNEYDSSSAIIQVNSGEETYLDFTLRKSAVSKIYITVSGNNHDASRTVGLSNIVSSELSLQVDSNTPKGQLKSIDDSLMLSCQAIGNLPKILVFSFDGDEIGELSLDKTSNISQSISVPKKYRTHGYHTVKIELFLNSSGNVGNPVRDPSIKATPLEFELAIKDNNPDSPPIIWLGEYSETYYNYDTITIPYRVYNPSNTIQAKVDFKINNAKTSTVEITNFDSFNYWEITDNNLGPKNCEIICGTTIRQFSFQIEQDPDRSMELAMPSSLRFNFDPSGRTNDELSSSRNTYINNNIKVDFKDFNWRNNGWTKGSNNQTCLKISNGASISIPLKELIFGGATTQQHSFEIQLKITNIQKYDNLIKNVTRYYYYPKGIITGEDNDKVKDDEFYANFIKQTLYDNYDNYLRDNMGTVTVNGITYSLYDTLEFMQIQKNISYDNIVCKVADINNNTATGFCVGTQDTFFSNGIDTVNVSFVEEDMINLSCVYDKGLGLLLIYINGVITGVAKSSVSEFQIKDSNFTITSNNCDIELYKFRVYDTALDVNSICINYAVDRKNVLVYDQLKLGQLNVDTREYQLSKEKIDEYNEEHILSNYTMPYIIFDTSVNENLPHVLPSEKSTGVYAVVDFVNVPLDKAYQNGDLEQIVKNEHLIDENETNRERIDEAVKTYYKYHCPSFTTRVSDRLRPTSPNGNEQAIERIELTVQGTSSQAYPRKNFKGKPKCTNEVWDDEASKFKSSKLLNIYMNKGPYAREYAQAVQDCVEDLEAYKKNTYGKESFRLADGWYMNNYTNATDRWTFKVDYMESSGSYNAGFANMVSQAYTKHPLKDYLDVLVSSDKDNKTVKDLLSSEITNSLNWDDYRTSMQGFPVMAFQKISKKGGPTGEGTYVFIGYYRMLIDKGSDQIMGFSPNKNINTPFVKKPGTEKNASLKDVVECWEYSNNSRTYCSFRDPDSRVQLSFTKTPNSKNEFNANKTLDVMDNFEYRYNTNENYLDYFFTFGSQQESTLESTFASMRKDLGLDENEYPAPTNLTDIEQIRAGNKYLSYIYRNWEKACQWVWSTNLEAVASQGTYIKTKVGQAIYEKDKYYLKDAEGQYILSNEDFDEEHTYYLKDDSKVNVYKIIRLCRDKDTLYTANKFYQKVSDSVYSLLTSSTFDSTINDYYVFNSRTSEELAKVADHLMKKADGIFSPSENYYTFNSQAVICTDKEKKPTGAYTKVELPTEEDFNKGLYYIPTSVIYNGQKYEYDTVEYRSAKFVNELSKHFDLEYLATYFIMTEFFECYDSRGKNCMMASWGPKEEGGDYIWYPIFYDIDTQLGINNSGIPSFDFNVDATERNNFSTSDSILWNNFYTFFKNSQILNKYKQLRDVGDTKLTYPPLKSVDVIEKYYEFDPTVLSSERPNIACEGVRPLIATNLDMYYKYITITNSRAIDAGYGVTNPDGTYKKTDNGTYYYALQGDRQQSRRQFLTNRMEYIDSWLGQGNYVSGNLDCFRGRVSANDEEKSDGKGGEKISDTYLATNDSQYWEDGKEFGTKLHKFDAEYWMKLKPIYSIYTTLKNDNDYTYPPQKYDGVAPVTFSATQIKEAILGSKDYHEQLFYVYGTKTMSDFGDLHNFYWAELFMGGDYPKLTSLRLGYDGPPDKKDGRTWYNRKFGTLSLAPMPLLKDINLSNISFTESIPIDLSASEKLENFRALGSGNINRIDFADGVALNTAYMPISTKELKLIETKQLRKLITKRSDITIEEKDNGTLEATPGLYLEGFFNESGDNPCLGDIETNGASLYTINLVNDALHYGSFKILYRLYQLRHDATSTVSIRMQGVNWCPYTLIDANETYDVDKAENYYILNDHYSFNKYTFTSADQFKEDAASNILYLDTGDYRLEYDIIDDDAFKMLKDLQGQNGRQNNFTGIAIGTKPEISGIIYIKNKEAIKESEIFELQKYYPKLTFVVENVEQDCYTAKFVYYDSATKAISYVPHAKDSDATPSVQKILKTDLHSGITQFEAPWGIYSPEKDNYDFIGWCSRKEAKIGDSDIQVKDKGWTETIEEGTFEYTYYAIFNVHSYRNTFYNYDGSIIEVKEIPYGEQLTIPTVVPYRPWDSDAIEDLYKAYDFNGYSTTPNGNKINVESLISEGDQSFYAIFTTMKDIRNVVHEDWFDYEYIENMALDSGWLDDSNIWISNKNDRVPQPSIPTITGYFIKPKTNKILQGKITLPSTYNDKKVVGISSNFMNNNTQKITHIFCEKNKSSIYYISERAFENSTTLEYFDFTPNTVRQIAPRAFARCKELSPELIAEYPLSSNLYLIDSGGFSGAFRKANSPIIFKVPSELRYVVNGGLCYMIDSDNNTLQLGDRNNPSKIAYNYPSMLTPTDTTAKFLSNVNSSGNPTFKNIIIYTKQYSSIEDKVGEWIDSTTELGKDAILYQYFVPGYIIQQGRLNLYNFDVERVN